MEIKKKIPSICYSREKYCEAFIIHIKQSKQWARCKVTNTHDKSELFEL